MAQYPKDEKLRDELLRLCDQSEDYAAVTKLLLNFLVMGGYQPQVKKRLAYAYEKNGQKKLAIQTLKSVIGSGHGGWEEHHSLYLMYRRCQDFEGLVQWRKEQLSKLPKSPEKQFELAEACYLNRQFDEEIALLHQLIAGDKQGSETHRYRHQLGLAYRGKEDHQAEIATFKSIINDNPDAVETRGDLAKAYQHAGEYTSAVEFLKGYLGSVCSAECNYLTAAFEYLGEDGEIIGWREQMESHPNWGHVRGHLLEAYAKKGDHNSAIQLLEDLVDKWPSENILHRELAEAYSKAPDFRERAVSGWMTLIDKHPAYLSLRDQLELFYHDNCDHQTAIEGWQSLLAKDPDDTDSHRRLANAFNQAGNHEKEAAVLVKLLESDPSNSNIQLDLELSLEKAADPMVTIECWTRMVGRTTYNSRERPMNRVSKVFEDRLERAFLDAREFDFAIRFWKQLIIQFPFNDVLHKRLEIAYETKGDLKDSIAGWTEIVESLLSINSGDSLSLRTRSLRTALWHLKKSYDATRELDAAIVYCSSLLEVFPDNREVIRILETLFEEKDDIDVAIKNWMELLELNPSSTFFVETA